MERQNLTTAAVEITSRITERVKIKPVGIYVSKTTMCRDPRHRSDLYNVVNTFVAEFTGGNLSSFDKKTESIQALWYTLPPILSDVQLEKNKMNRLIWGNNLLAMQALLASGYEGKISLIYIDPPFWTNENYYAKFEIADKEITKLPSVIERLAYKDIWEGGIDSRTKSYRANQLGSQIFVDSGPAP